MGSCFLCSCSTETRCSECRDVFFCCNQHAQIHRRDGTCFPFRIGRGEGVGHYMLATRDIQPLETILEESAVVIGTKLEHQPVCLECFTPTEQGCGECGLPLCGSCIPKRHKIECQVLKIGGKLTPSAVRENAGILASISVIRFIHTSHKDTQMAASTDWLVDNLTQLEEFCPDRKVFRQCHSFLKHRLGDRPEYSEEAVYRTLGVLKSNCVSIAGYNGRALFPTFALINHSCISNARQIVTSDEGVVEVVAQTHIKRGEEINIRYTTDPLQTLSSRRRHIRETWCFHCYCPLCRDPTELNTFLSAISCQKCKAGHLLPTHRQANSFEYVCNNCPHTLTQAQVESIELKVKTALEKIERSSIKKLESFLKVCHSILHPNHGLSLAVRNILINLYFQPQNPLEIDNLSEKLRCVAEYTRIVTTLDPGYTKRRSKLLYLTCRVELLVLLQDLQSGKVSPSGGVAEIQTQVDRLEAALAGITGSAASLSPPGENLRTRIRKLCETPGEADLGQGFKMILTILLRLPFVK